MMLAFFAAAVGQSIYVDPQHDVKVEYARPTAGEVRFSAKLPAGWSFVVRVDGDQNGKWGEGTGTPLSMRRTPDVTFGQDRRGGVFCSQSIYTARPDDPEQPYASSECGELPSQGRVELSGLGADGKATITIILPTEELFGGRSTAWIQTCVWDTKRMTCQNRLSAPLVLTRG